MMPLFILNLISEYQKVKGTIAFWLTVGGAGFIPLVNSLRLIGRPDIFVPKMQVDIWSTYLKDNWSIAAAFLLPLYVILIATVVVQIETANNTWKQVLASPRRYADIFLSKFLVLQSLIILCFVWFCVLIVLSGFATALIVPRYPFFSSAIPWAAMWDTAVKLYVSILGISAIQYGLSLRFRNPLAPIGIGIALLIGGFMIREWEHIAYYPYMHSILVYFHENVRPGASAKALSNSSAICALACLGGLLEFSLRKEKG